MKEVTGGTVGLGIWRVRNRCWGKEGFAKGEMRKFIGNVVCKMEWR